MINLFLKAKHWQLFGLMMGFILLDDFFTAGSEIFNINIEHNLNLKIGSVFPLGMFVYIGLLFSWFWSIAIGLQNKIPRGIKMKVKKFKVFFFIPLIYMVFILVYFEALIHGRIQNIENPSSILIITIVGIVVPLHLFSMFCIFYLMYFVAKTIKIVEVQKEVIFENFIGEFFMLWFFPIGIWIIQPKINKYTI